MASEIKAELLKIPPVTRFLCASQLVVSLPVMLQILSPYQVVFVWQLVIKRYEIWRLFTSFFLGGSGINFIFDFVMLYRNSDGLESTYYARRSADYAWQLFIAAGVILGLSRPLHTVVHTRPLLIALTYVSSLLAPPGAQSSIFGLVTLPVRYYPYLMVAMDLLMAGPAVAASGVVGLVVGHGWWWGVFGGPGGRGVLERWSKAPAWVKSIVNDRPPGAAAPSGGVHATAPRARAGPEPRSGSTTGYQWGSGRRLGDS